MVRRPHVWACPMKSLTTAIRATPGSWSSLGVPPVTWGGTVPRRSPVPSSVVTVGTSCMTAAPTPWVTKHVHTTETLVLTPPCEGEQAASFTHTQAQRGPGTRPHRPADWRQASWELGTPESHSRRLRCPAGRSPNHPFSPVMLDPKKSFGRDLQHSGRKRGLSP